mmetsp:Transcript_5104/g.12093  ORF Transcript_5104/g.12093 Transcript_5104/m.12093 type:complete len:205 (-) Transcript_5104:780-1394(-)
MQSQDLMDLSKTSCTAVLFVAKTTLRGMSCFCFAPEMLEAIQFGIQSGKNLSYRDPSFCISCMALSTSFVWNFPFHDVQDARKRAFCIPWNSSPGLSGSHFTVTLSFDNICCDRSSTVALLYFPDANEFNGAKPLMRKCAFLKGTRLVCSFRRSAFKGPVYRRQDVMPDMQRAMMLFRSTIFGMSFSKALWHISPRALLSKRNT